MTQALHDAEFTQRTIIFVFRPRMCRG
jgi:hypothetical protein